MNAMEKYYAVGLICLGACLGALLRWAVYGWADKTFGDTLIATLTVNIVGSFFIGILFALFNEIDAPRLQLLLMTGLLASFTTFSTLSLDALKLLISGQLWLAFSHLGGQIVFGISFCYFGVRIGQRILT